MPNQPRGRLLALLLSLQAKANAILLPANQAHPRFRYYARRFKELQGIVNAINTQYPGEIDVAAIERYGRNISGLVTYLDGLIADVASAYSSGSTNSSSSRSDVSTSSRSDVSTSSASPSSASTSSASPGV